MFTKREQIHLLISILVLTFLFGFDDGAKSFVFQHWLLNLIIVFIFVIIAILFREFIVKFFARRHDAASEYEIWRIKRVWFGGSGKLKRGFLFGIIASIVLTLGSKGKFFFTALGVHNLSEYESARVGRKQQTLSYFEEAQIVSMGLLSGLFLAVIGLLFGRIFDINMTQFVNLNFYMVLFNMIPLSHLDGAKIFFGSVFLYIFMLVFLIVTFLLIQFGIILSLLLSFLAAIIVVVIYFYYINF